MSTPINNSVLRAFTLLRGFDRPGEWLTCRELSRRAGMPEASGYRLVVSLEAVGAVIRGPRGGFRPGMLLAALSQGVMVNDLLRVTATPFARDIVRRFGVTVQAGVLEAGMVSYVMVAGRPEVPARASAHCSALGKVLLAGLPAGDLDRFLQEDELVALTPHTIVDKDLLRARIEQIRLQGYGIDDRELDLHLRCVAVPIRDRRNRVIAAISGSARPAALDSTRQVELRLALEDAAEGIAAQLYPAAANSIPT
jgi:DNA-binding IclR family transcriptional regulator